MCRVGPALLVFVVDMRWVELGWDRHRVCLANSICGDGVQ